MLLAGCAYVTVYKTYKVHAVVSSVAYPGGVGVKTLSPERPRRPTDAAVEVGNVYHMPEGALPKIVYCD